MILMLALVWIRESGEACVAGVVVASGGRVISLMPWGRSCCRCRSFSTWAWAWAVSWLKKGYWDSCCSRLKVSIGTT